MKTAIIFFVLSLNVFAQDISNCEEIKYVESFEEYGAIHSKRDRTSMGTSDWYCVNEDGHETKIYPNIGFRMESWGATLGYFLRGGGEFIFSNVKGRRIDELCGTYKGLKQGAGIILGVTEMAAINNKTRITVHNWSIAAATGTDVSYVRVKVVCN